METEILRIIEGGFDGNKRKIIAYSKKLADRLSREGNQALAECILEKISYYTSQEQKDTRTVRTTPLESMELGMDPGLKIVKVVPSDNKRHPLVISQHTAEDIADCIDIIKNHKKWEKAGHDIKKTFIFYGKSASINTMVVHYISEKTGLQLMVVRLDNLVTSSLDTTAKNLQKIFDYVRNIPCILFLDGVEALAKLRADTGEIGESDVLINSLLQNIERMNPSSRLIGTTIQGEIIDSPLLHIFGNVIEVC